MTPIELFQKLAVILGKTEMEIHRSAYISLLHDMVEIYEKENGEIKL